ncbi:MAG TPA: type II secretion system F family protein, partial [Sphingomonadales bacterium]|nr:type II secretion system F family protein [Sphingomonadales bacterium]
LLVRGLRSGLPITESMGSVAKEIPDPVGTEFRKVIDNIRLGRDMDEALKDVATRIEAPEFKFFMITLAIQRETGGNLAETLAKLSDLLRRRQAMKLKIRAMASEGKASAYIVGSLPFVLFTLLLFLNYDYTSVLFTDIRAIFASVVGLTWLSLGGFIMSRMIAFEI